MTRRSLLTGLAGSVITYRAFAQSDDPLQQLIQQNQGEGLGESFDSTSRTIAMPKASLPTLSSTSAGRTAGCHARYTSPNAPHAKCWHCPFYLSSGKKSSRLS